MKSKNRKDVAMARPKNNQASRVVHQTDGTSALTLQPQPQSHQPAGRISKKIGSTTYHVSVFFSQTNKETINDKIVRLIKNEALGF